jgi:hypothetical protein
LVSAKDEHKEVTEAIRVGTFDPYCGSMINGCHPQKFVKLIWVGKLEEPRVTPSV